MSYLRFGAMIATSTVVMFILMYLNTYAWEHVFWSETRAYMAVLMGATMAVIMLGYMLSMYSSKGVNIAIFVGSVVVFALMLWLVRSQATVSGVSYMRAMIPHHSIAIMTSERAQIDDPRVRKLADEIIAAQQKEIAEMRYLIADISGDEDAVPPETFDGDEAAEVASVEAALDAPVIASLDPAPLNEAEAGQVLEPGPGCLFKRTAESDPILAIRAPEDGGAARGVMKLSGKLVPLQSEAGGDLAAGATMTAEGVRMAVRPLRDDETLLGDGFERADAELVFQLDQGLTVGYRGFYSCDA
jgi:hypothetical protein